MKTIEEIKIKIREDQQIYKDQYKVKELKIFGSYVKSYLISKRKDCKGGRISWESL